MPGKNTRFMDERLAQWGHELEEVRLPRWKELPDLNLYMDQVVTYINQTLSFLQADSTQEKDKLLTPAMINNYVKLKLIPKPEKKRYTREHLALLIVIVTLKPVLSLTQIHEGIDIQLTLCKNHVWTAYNLFCRQFERSLKHMSDLTLGKEIDTAYIGSLPMYILGPHMAIISLSSKLLSEKVLLIKNEEMALSKPDELL